MISEYLKNKKAMEKVTNKKHEIMELLNLQPANEKDAAALFFALRSEIKELHRLTSQAFRGI